MFILLLYALQDCGTATNVGRNVAYAMAIVLTSPYVLGYQFPYGSQPEFENKCQLINMRSLQWVNKIVDPSITHNITLQTVLRMMYLRNTFI